MNTISIIETIRAREAVGAYVLSVLPYLAPENAREVLQALADEQHAAYPQYRGHFEGYVLCRVTRHVSTKGGVAFERGDLAIACLDTRPAARVSPFYSHATVWSARTGWDTSVERYSVRPIGGDQ